MIYTPMTNRALRLAADAHRGQTDKAGMPYLLHPFHLAEQMTDEISVCVALLHDVVEDSSVTFAQLDQEFPPEVTGPVRLLTHEKGTDYLAYVRALRSDPVAPVSYTHLDVYKRQDQGHTIAQNRQGTD